MTNRDSISFGSKDFAAISPDEELGGLLKLHAQFRSSEPAPIVQETAVERVCSFNYLPRYSRKGN